MLPPSAVVVAADSIDRIELCKAEDCAPPAEEGGTVAEGNEDGASDSDGLAKVFSAGSGPSKAVEMPSISPPALSKGLTGFGTGGSFRACEGIAWMRH